MLLFVSHMKTLQGQDARIASTLCPPFERFDYNTFPAFLEVWNSFSLE